MTMRGLWRKMLARQFTMVSIVSMLLVSMMSVSAEPIPPIVGASSASSNMTCLFYNCRDSPMSDPALRKAFSFLIDRELICGNTTDWTVDKLRYFIPTSMTGWVDDSSYLHFSLEDAWLSLDAAGYTIDNATNRRIDPETGEPMRDLKLYTPPYWEDSAQWVAGEVVFTYATLLGLPLKHLTLSFENLTTLAMSERGFDIVAMNVSLSTPPVELYDLLHSSQDKAGTVAYSGIRDADLDASLEGLKSGSEADQKASCLSVQKRLAELVPFAPVYTPRPHEVEVGFIFDRVGVATVSNTTKYLGVAFDYVELLDSKKVAIAKYDMGTSDTSAGRTGDGFYENQMNWDGVSTYVWAGGASRVALIYIVSSPDAAYLRLSVNPYLANNPIHVYVDGVEVDSFTPTVGWAQYTVPMTLVAPEKLGSSITCSVSGASMKPGESLTISGVLNPVSVTSVNLSITAPSGHISVATLRTGGDGSYSYSFQPQDKGTWRAQVSWAGDEGHLNCTSQQVSWTVAEEPASSGGTSNGGIPGYPNESIVLGIIICLVCLVRARYVITHPNTLDVLRFGDARS